MPHSTRAGLFPGMWWGWMLLFRNHKLSYNLSTCFWFEHSVSADIGWRSQASEGLENSLYRLKWVMYLRQSHPEACWVEGAFCLRLDGSEGWLQYPCWQTTSPDLRELNEMTFLLPKIGWFHFIQWLSATWDSVPTGNIEVSPIEAPE